MTKTRADTFEERLPKISNADIDAAARANRVVGSWNSLPVIDKDERVISLAIKFSLLSGASETVLLDRYSATILLKALEALESVDWAHRHIAPRGKKLH